jgi:nucleoside-diphosphate-sugar epimerase
VQDEKRLRATIRKHQNRTLVIPSLIYGQGSGPGNQRSIQIPELARIAIERKRAAQIGTGANIWSNVYISDLSSLLVSLVESAVSNSDDKRIWGASDLFFAGADGGISFGSAIKQIATAAHQFHHLPDTEVDEISASEADKLSPHASAIVGTNARTLSERAQEVLGGTHRDLLWKTKFPSLWNTCSVDRLMAGKDEDAPVMIGCPRNMIRTIAKQVHVQSVPS